MWCILSQSVYFFLLFILWKIIYSRDVALAIQKCSWNLLVKVVFNNTLNYIKYWSKLFKHINSIHNRDAALA